MGGPEREGRREGGRETGREEGRRAGMEASAAAASAGALFLEAPLRAAGDLECTGFGSESSVRASIRRCAP